MAIDPLQVVVAVQNKQELLKLTLDAKAAEIEIEKLNAAFQQGKVSSAAFAAGVKPFADTITTTVPRMKELEHSMNSAGMTGGRGFAQGMLQASYAIDDLQYGMR